MNALDEYKGKKVFITGHTGFKGSWFVLMLQEVGAEVCGYSLPAGEMSVFKTLNIADHCLHIEGDLLDYKHLEKSILDFQPDFVFHLAAQSLVRKSYIETRGTFETNVIGTLNLLECMKGYDRSCKIIIVTTDKVYENIENSNKRYTEADAIGANDPYSTSKACTELLVRTYLYSFSKEFANKAIETARAGNVVGGGDWADDRLIPDMIKSIWAGQTMNLRNPKSTRPWQYVLDVLSGYLLLGAYISSGSKRVDGWNFGPADGEVLTVEDIVKLSISEIGQGSYTISAENQFKEATYLGLESSKSRTELEWKPTYNSKESIIQALKWYKKRIIDPDGIKEYSISEIKAYLNA